MLRILWAVLVLLVSGCSEREKPPYPTVTITGKVILYGEPLKQGAISFIPEPGTTGAATGGEILGGAYALKGVPKGTHRVFITLSGTAPTVFSTGETVSPEPLEALPKRYQEGLMTEVIEDGRIDFDIIKSREQNL
ncbi:MAG TPA: hypothetical protein VNQ76_18455 [Planctomicrobium sp.]|nr:hypothetical protein [Planctomicrobium sp.]